MGIKIIISRYLLFLQKELMKDEYTDKLGRDDLQEFSGLINSFPIIFKYLIIKSEKDPSGFHIIYILKPLYSTTA